MQMTMSHANFSENNTVSFSACDLEKLEPGLIFSILQFEECNINKEKGERCEIVYLRIWWRGVSKNNI